MKKIKALKAASFFLICIIPIVCVLFTFPLLRQTTAPIVSGITVLVLLIFTTAFRRKLKALIKNPTPWMLYLALTAILLVMQPIIDKMIVCFIISTVSSVIGTLLQCIARCYESEARDED